MKNWLRWQKGRQASGYDKMLLATARLPFAWLQGFDVYVLRFPVGSHIPAHKEVVDSGRLVMDAAKRNMAVRLHVKDIN